MIWHKRIVRVIEEGKDEAAFKAEINSDQYAYTIMMLIEGGVLLSRTLGSITQLNIALDRILKIIDEEIKV
ncbi:hypothetical protein NBY09_15745 [Elizabethkingia anophelis]|nr:hypothetical protein [Elizabethkingia anophelis]MDC8027602.1 hypothetical protein [Elizabethkingia anophelis]